MKYLKPQVCPKEIYAIRKAFIYFIINILQKLIQLAGHPCKLKQKTLSKLLEKSKMI